MVVWFESVEYEWMNVKDDITAFVSVAIAEATNIIVNVAMISMIRAWMCVPEGDVVPSSLSGSNKSRSVKEAVMAPVSWATM